MKKKGIGSDARAERMVNTNVDLQLLNQSERGRELQKQKKRRLQGREDDVCLKCFQSAIINFQYNMFFHKPKCGFAFPHVNFASI